MKILWPGIVALVAGVASQAQVVSYTFGATGTPVASAASLAANIQSASSFASLVGTGAPSASGTGSNSAGGGGGAYFTASNWRSTDGNYFWFTVTPSTNYQLSLTSFSFFYAASSTGPTTATLYSSANGYSTALANFTLTPASGNIAAADWHQNMASITLTGITSATTFRLTATGASNAAGSLRIDAVSLGGTVTAIPEPSTYAAILGAGALTGVIIRRKRQAKSA